MKIVVSIFSGVLASAHACIDVFVRMCVPVFSRISDCVPTGIYPRETKNEKIEGTYEISERGLLIEAPTSERVGISRFL